LRFIASYRRNAAGVDHTLLIIWKEFSESEKAPVRQALKDLAYEEFDTGEAAGAPRTFDIPIFLRLVRERRERYFVHLTTTDKIHVDDWLALMAKGLKHAPVIGTNGSWQSHLTSCSQGLPNFGARLRWVVPPEKLQYQPWPNPHIRSNGFVGEARFLRRFQCDDSKEGTYFFESGVGGMSATLRQLRLPLLVCGRDGRLYDERVWPKARTFRIGLQENAIISDHHHDDYTAAPPAVRVRMTVETWGRAAARLPSVGVAGANASIGVRSGPLITSVSGSSSLHTRGVPGDNPSSVPVQE
jgi:hypothetical protein